MPSSRPLPLPRRSNPWRGRALALACGLAACGDDASPAESRDAQVDASAPNDGGSSAQDAADRSGDAAVGAHDASHHGDAASEPVDAAQGADAEAHDAGRDASAPDASPACVTFCTCMAANCADKVFQDGCLVACASHPRWDLACRQVMCALVPDQPDNDHCTHAMGIVQCLDL